MRANVACHYCDKTWEQYVYNSLPAKFKCPKCGETKNFSIRPLTTNLIDYYQGSPEFVTDMTDFGSQYENYSLISE